MDYLMIRWGYQMGVEREDLQKMRSEQIHHILQQDEQLGREQSMFQDVGQMQENREVIDQALMKSGEWKLTDKEQYRLRAIQGRTISHLLLNQNQFSTDSPEMSLVKQNVEKLEEMLAREWTAQDAADIVVELEGAYQSAIAACQNYCEHKKPTFRSGKERKLMVQETLQQLRTESGQMRLAKQMIEQGELPEYVQRQRDLLVAAQDYQGGKTAQTDAVAQPVGITALTYADFASMLGTHNRGQIEFAGKGLRMINNHARSVSSGTASEDHFLVREQLLIRAAEKLGEQATPEFVMHLQEVLGLNAESHVSKPLSRKELYEVITEVNLRASRLAQTLKAGEGAPESRRVFAQKVNQLIGGQLGEWDVTYTPKQVEQQMKQTLSDLFRMAQENGVRMPKLSTHQMDVLVKGNLPLLRDNLFQSMNTVYDAMCRMNQGQDVNVQMVSDSNTLIYQLLSYEISKITAETPELREIAGQEQRAYMTGMAFVISEQMQLGNDFADSNVGDLAVGGAQGLEEAAQRLWLDSGSWTADEKKQMQRGCDALGTLCTQLQTLSQLQEKALYEGLDETERLNMNQIAAQIQQVLQEKDDNSSDPRLADMEYAAGKLAGTRFAEGLKTAKQRVRELHFSFTEASERISRQVRPLQHNRTLAQRVNGHADMDQTVSNAKQQQEHLSSQGQKVLQIFMLEKKASDLVKKSNDETAGEIRELRKVLRQFQVGVPQMQRIQFAGADIQLLQDETGTLSMIEGHGTILLPFSARMMADRLETEMVENESRYGVSEIEAILQSVDTRESADVSGGTMVRGRSLCLKLLQSRTGQPAAFFNNVPVRMLKNYALQLLSGEIQGEAVIRDVCTLENKALINGEEALALLKKGEQIRAEESHVQLAKQKPKADTADGPQWEERQLKVKNMLSDLVFSTQTWELDENERATVEKLREAEASRDEEKIAQIRHTQSAERMRRVILNHPQALYAILRDPQLLNEMVDKLPFPGGDGEEADGMKASVRVLVQQILAMPQLEKFREMAHGPYEAIAKMGFQVFIGPLLSQPDAMEHLAQMDEQINGMVETSMASIQQMITESVSVVFKSEHADGEQPEHAVRREKYGDTPEELARWQKDSREQLNRMLREAANGDRGQGLFTKNVFQNYFGGVTRMDQRAMLASALRNARPVEAADGMSEQEQETRQKKIMGNYLGGILKGAGPLLQKMMQGMPLDSMPEELKSALKDMRSNLAPIPDEIVKAQLRSMIERSNGKVTDIVVERALGAASVGQAFLCTLKGPNLPPEGKGVVVKLLRPNVRNYMMREKDIMIRCARMTDGTQDLPPETIGGMEATYRGQLLRIEEELDLTIEARNVETGQLYNEGAQTVQAMKLNPLVEPTVNAMVVEKAPGTTLDQYVGQVRADFRQKMEPFYKKKANGEIMLNGDGAPQMEFSGNADYAAAYSGLCEMYQQLFRRQEYLVALANKWVTEGVFGRGFYHGDLHAGNIMVDDDRMTIIDFGNATKLDTKQQSHVVKMMLAAGYGMVDDFRHSFHMLLQNTPEEKYQEKREALGKMLKEVFEMGSEQDTGSRIAVVLLKAQELGLELPPAIANFSQSQIRLQQTIDEINTMISEVRDAIVALREKPINPNNPVDALESLLSVAGNSDRMLQKDVFQKLMPMDLSREQYMADLYGHNTEEERAAFEEKSVAALQPKSFYMSRIDELIAAVTPDMIRQMRADKPADQQYKKRQIDDMAFRVRMEIIAMADKYGMQDDPEIKELKDAMIRAGRDPLAADFQENLRSVKARLESYQQMERQEADAYIAGYRDRLHELWALKDRPDHPQAELEQKESAFYDSFMKRQAELLAGNTSIRSGMDMLFDDPMERKILLLCGDTAYLGPQLREAYQSYREAKAQNLPELEQRKDHLRSVYLQMQSRNMREFVEAMEQTVPDRLLATNPDTFFDVMADVIMTNKKAAANRLGIFYAMKVMFR